MGIFFFTFLTKLLFWLWILSSFCILESLYFFTLKGDSARNSGLVDFFQSCRYMPLLVWMIAGKKSFKYFLCFSSLLEYPNPSFFQDFLRRGWFVFEDLMNNAWIFFFLFNSFCLEFLELLYLWFLSVS